MLHFVIATKQPSMTAATLAAAISQAGGRLRDTERIVDLLAATLRSQLAARSASSTETPRSRT